MHLHPWLDLCRARGWPSGPVPRRCCLALVALALCCEAGAQQRPRQELLQLYSGVYAGDCQDAAAPRLRLSPDAMVAQHAGQRLVGRKLRDVPPPPMPLPVPQFRLAVTGELPTGGTLEIEVFEDRRGPYVNVLGDARVQALLGKGLAPLRYRRCEDAPAQTAKPAAPPIPAQDEAPSEAEKMLLDPRFRSAYLGALGSLGKERWLAELDGPRPPTRQVRLEGVDYTVIAVCKPHDCADHNTVVLYAAGDGTLGSAGTVYGKVVRAGKSSFIGEPPPAMATALDTLWAAEWRRR